MKLNRKLEIVDQAVKSISQHTDEDAAVRAAALDRISEMVKWEKAKLDDEVKAGIDAALAPEPTQAPA